MGHVQGEWREQRLLLAPSLDEVLASDHPVRLIDAFVVGMDLAALGFSKVATQATGRPPYDPADLLRLYVYGYLNQIRSSRRLEREAGRNLEVQWLINHLTPSFKTIADFRRDHAASIVGVCRAFVRFCADQSLYGGELVAIDGSKIEAAASREKVITPRILEKRMAAIEGKIAHYLAAMDEADQAEAAAEGAPPDIAAALAVLRARRDEVQAQAQALADEGLSQRVIGEPEAKLMRTARAGHKVAYNAQTAVDDKHGLIAAFDLTSEGNDQRQLLPMAEQAKAALEAETLTVVADVGYSNGEQGRACEAAAITAVVPRQRTVNPKNSGLFTRDAFAYDAAKNSWTCPAGETLVQIKVDHAKRKTTYATRACGGCALKGACTKAKRRMILRSFDEDAMEAMHRRSADNPAWMQRRRELAEHPFGVIKWMLGHPRFLVRGLKKAKSELALVVLGFNLKRAIAILGVPALLAALQPAAA
jgi:transposase